MRITFRETLDAIAEVRSREMREQFATDLRLLYSPTLSPRIFPALLPQCPSLFFVFCFIQNSTAIHVKKRI